jgi:hypothetical protein
MYAYEILKMYIAQVCVPLGLRLNRSYHMWQWSDGYGTDDSVLTADNIREKTRNRAIAIVRTSVETFIDHMPVDDRASEWTDELRKLPEYLPDVFTQQPYDVLHSYTATAAHGGATTPVPAVLKPLNVISIQARKGEPAIDTLEALEDFAASGFDLLHCCIALRLDPDLRAATREVLPGAYRSARVGSLILRPPLCDILPPCLSRWPI